MTKNQQQANLESRKLVSGKKSLLISLLHKYVPPQSLEGHRARLKLMLTRLAERSLKRYPIISVNYNSILILTTSPTPPPSA